MPNQTRPDQNRPDQTRSDQNRSDHTIQKVIHTYIQAGRDTHTQSDKHHANTQTGIQTRETYIHHTNRQADRGADIQTGIHTCIDTGIHTDIQTNVTTYRQADIQPGRTDRQHGIQTGRQADRQTSRAYRRTGSQTGRHTDRYTGRQNIHKAITEKRY